LTENGAHELSGRIVTVNERLLLHLRDFSQPRHREEVPPQVTQEGIAETLGIRPNHVPRAVRRLIGEGAVEEITTHVTGYARRRKTYFLTEKGLAMADGVLRRISEVPVTVEFEAGERKTLTLLEAQSALPGKPRMSHLLRALGEDGIIQTDILNGRPRVSEGFIDLSANHPRSQLFFGRGSELEELRAWLDADAPRVIILSGLKGIGKTALALKALDHVRGKRHIFWHSFHSWDTTEALGNVVSSCAAAMRKGPLRLDTSLDKLPGTLKCALPCLNCVAILDNLFELEEETENLCHELIEVFATTPGGKLIVTTREEGMSQRFRAYTLAGNLAEMRIQGLDRESAKMLVNAGGIPLPDFDRVYSITSGHPLVLELINSEEILALVDDSGLSREEALVLRCLKAFDYILS
jgi:DNA-binding MarR family transcriptional regulator